MTQAASPHPTRLSQLDGLRGMAALVIMLYHLDNVFRIHGPFMRGDLMGDLFFPALRLRARGFDREEAARRDRGLRIHLGAIQAAVSAGGGRRWRCPRSRSGDRHGTAAHPAVVGHSRLRDDPRVRWNRTVLSLQRPAVDLVLGGCRQLPPRGSAQESADQSPAVYRRRLWRDAGCGGAETRE